MVGRLALDMIDDLKDDVCVVRDQLDQFDKVYGRDTGESLVACTGSLRCAVYFDSVSAMKEAYLILVNSRHKKYITKIKPTLE